MILCHTTQHNTSQVQVNKSFYYIVTSNSLYWDFMLMAPFGPHPGVQSPRSLLRTEVVAAAGESGYQHHKFAEVDLSVSVQVQTVQHFVHLARVLCRLRRPTRTYCSKRYNTALHHCVQLRTLKSKRFFFFSLDQPLFPIIFRRLFSYQGCIIQVQDGNSRTPRREGQKLEIQNLPEQYMQKMHSCKMSSVSKLLWLETVQKNLTWLYSLNLHVQLQSNHQNCTPQTFLGLEGKSLI